MKIIFLILTTLFLSSCNNESEYESDISSPELDQETIDLNQRYIESYQDLITKYEDDIENSDNDTVIEMHEDEIKKLNNLIFSSENNIEIAEDTYIYNDEFMTVGNHAVIIDRAESVLSDSTAPSLFSNNLIRKIKFYDSNNLIEQAVIGSLLVPLEGEGTEVVAISIYLTKETLDKVDLDELTESYNDIYEFSEGVHAHGSLEEHIKTDNSQLTDDQHEVFYMLMNGITD